MKKYNQALQYKLALEANVAPIGSVVIFPEEYLQCGLVYIPLKNSCLQQVRFVYSNYTDDFGLTEVNCFSSN